VARFFLTSSRARLSDISATRSRATNGGAGAGRTWPVEIEVFWGTSNYDFFIYSADMGVCLLKYENGSWLEDYQLRFGKNQNNQYIASLYAYGKTYPYDINNLSEEIYKYYAEVFKHKN